MRVFIGMETSGATRRAFQAAGHKVVSCDLLPAQDGAGFNEGHIVGDVFEVLAMLERDYWWKPDLALFHPDCTWLTVSAAWVLKDPDYVRYPGVGYHQRLKPGTLFGKARRDAQAESVELVKRIWALDIKRLAIENPVGQLSTLWMKPTQIIQPYEFGEDASKATCLWLRNLPPLKGTERFPGRWVEWPRGSGIMRERWSNQTDSGQSNLTPSDDRWQDRADTYPGISNAMVTQWSI